MIENSGFGPVEIEGPVDVFAGAEGEGNARKFATYGYTFRATKTHKVTREHVVQACMI